MKKTTILKSLVVAAGMLVGTSAWAQTTAFEQDFTAKEVDGAVSTNPADYGFELSYGNGSNSNLVNFTVNAGVLNCVAGPYESSTAGNRTGTATATFNGIGVGNEITVSYIWSLGSATGNATGSYTKTRIGNASGNALELSFFGSENNGTLKVNGVSVQTGNSAIRNTTYTVTAKLNMNVQKITALELTCSNSSFSYTATDYIDFASAINSIDRFAFENSERQNWANSSSVDNVSIVYKEAKEIVNSIDVNYTFGGSTIFTESIPVADLYCGDEYTIPFRMYVVKDGELYQTSNNTTNPYYGQKVTLVANTIVEKALTKVDINGGIIEFFEDFDGSTGNNAGIRASYCGAYDNQSYTSENELPAGIYTFFVRAYSRNRGSSVKVGDTQVFTIAEVGGSWQNHTFENVNVPAPGKLSFVKGSGGTIDPIDIIIAVRQAESKTISAAGYATYYSANALDFTGTGLTAYVATIDGTQVRFAPVDKVPAQTGVLLKGAEGSYQIPVVADGGEATSALVGVLEAKKVPAGSFVLMDGAQGVGFYKTTSEFTVGANTAYLPAQTTGTARSFIGFDGESSTGISAVENSELRTESCFDLQGRRVAQPTKGLYIMNGKKTVVR